jgi:hypothetical protein
VDYRERAMLRREGVLTMVKKAKPPKQRKVVWAGDAPGGNYTEKVLTHAPEAVASGGVTQIDVAHDDWCAIFRGNPCNCSPTVKRRV